MEQPLNIRKAEIHDIDSILQVEESSFSTPWSREAFEGELTTNRFAMYYMLELEGQVAGYAGMWVIFDEAHVTNVAISPNFRGYQLGELLMRHMMATAKMHGAKRMTLEVRESNNIARKLYEKLDFQEEGIRKNYYADTMEDALIMWVNL